MIASQFSDLPHSREVAVIINVSTKTVTTLALLSTLRYARIPVVLIDCESWDGSFEWFRELMATHDFCLIQAKLKQHGETLDWIFQGVSAERILLVDSDVELLNSEMLSTMRAMLDSDPRLYGSGHVHKARWLDRHYCTDLVLAPGIGYYMERPWIPFALVRTKPIRLALSHGHSFMHGLVLNDVPQLPLVSRLLS